MIVKKFEEDYAVGSPVLPGCCSQGASVIEALKIYGKQAAILKLSVSYYG
jgi:predicted RNase H-like HicB family nuclease